MKRWHEDRGLMLSRWSDEMKQHGLTGILPPETCDDVCYRTRGMGTMRKRKPLDCGRARCAFVPLE